MNIAVLGAVCFDEIYTIDGGRTESFGGILYNIAAFSAIMRESETALPITAIGVDKYDQAIAEFRRFPHVDTRYVTKCSSPTTHVTLRWTGDTTRDETILHRMPPFTLDSLQPALQCDAAHFNFINGTEITLAVLREFRAAYAGLVSVDIHQLISRFGEDGKRTITGFRDWRDWLSCIDVVQGNELEVAHTLGRTLISIDDFRCAARELCEAGPRVVLVTVGSGGALMAYRSENRIREAAIPPFQPERAIETTGCGDSFSSGFLVGMLRLQDPVDSFCCAAIAAGANAQLRGLGRLADVTAILDRPREAFPGLMLS